MVVDAGLRGYLTSDNLLGYKRHAIMKFDTHQTYSAARYANWYWRATNQVAGVAFYEERQRE